MNILMIYEHHRDDADYKVASKIARELKKRHNVFVGYYVVKGKSPIQWTGDFNDEFIVQNEKRNIYYVKTKLYGWNNKSEIEKIKCLIRHPYLLYLYLYCIFDRKLEYFKYVHKLDEYCKKNNIELVMGVAYPYQIFSLISRMKSEVCKKCIQLDPYTYTECLPKKKEKKRFKEEIFVFNRIDKLYTTKLIKRDMVKNEPFLSQAYKIEEIEFPIIEKDEESICENSVQIITKGKDEISFLHAGAFYHDIRNPEKLARIFEKLPDNYILYVAGGNSYDIRKHDIFIRERVIDLGVLDEKQMKQANEEADFLISYNNLVDNQVPSKLFECINTGKPFLSICQLEDCPTKKYVEDYDNALIVDYKEGNIDIERVCEFVESHIGVRIAKEKIFKKYEKSTVEYVVSQLMD